MGDNRVSDDRLPWLATAPARAAVPPAARRARTPLLLVLALLAAGFIAALAFIAGRTTAPPTPRPTPSAPVTVRPPAPIAPAPVTAVISPPAPRMVTAPAPHRPRATAAERRPAARRPTRRFRRNPIPRITRAFPLSPVATAVPPQATGNETTAAPRQATDVARNAPPPRRATRAAPPSMPRRDVVQLGAYVTRPLADAAWGRLVGAYPYLSTLPRNVTVTAPSPGRPRYYRLRAAAGSRAQARALCAHLQRIGRGCMVVAK